MLYSGGISIFHSLTFTIKCIIVTASQMMVAVYRDYHNSFHHKTIQIFLCRIFRFGIYSHLKNKNKKVRNPLSGYYIFAIINE